MKRISARSVASLALRTTALAGAVGMTLALPAIWLAWEGAVAQAQASLVAKAAQDRAETALRGLFDGFERATGSLRADQVGGDSVALTSRLLLLEPMAAPASGLVVVDQRGVQVAASSPGLGKGQEPLWWAAEAAGLPWRQAGLLGCSVAANGAGYVVARPILDDAGHDVGAVAGNVPVSVLRDLAAPPTNATGVVAYALRDSAGCPLLAGGAATAAGAAHGEAGLVRLYRSLLPATWGKPNGVTVTARAGDLVLTGTVSPEAALSLRSAEIERGAATLQPVVLTLAGLQLLLALAPRVRRTDMRDVPVADPAVENRHRALVVGLSEADRRRVAAHLSGAGFAVDTAEDGFAAQRLSEQSGPLHRAMDLMVLDATLSGLSADALLSRLKRQMDFERLRVVLVANGKILGAVGGSSEAAAMLDATLAGVFAAAVPTKVAVEAQTFAPTRLRQVLASAATLSHAD